MSSQVEAARQEIPHTQTDCFPKLCLDSHGSWVSLCCSQVNKKLDLPVPQRPVLSPGALSVTGEKVPLSQLRLWHHLCLSHAGKAEPSSGSSSEPSFPWNYRKSLGFILTHFGVFNFEIVLNHRNEPLGNSSKPRANPTGSSQQRFLLHIPLLLLESLGKHSIRYVVLGRGMQCSETQSERSPLPGGSGLAGLRPMPPGPQSAAGQL